MNYIAALEILHGTLEPRSYLEIGCQYGHSLRLSKCPSVAVDPDFQVSVPITAATRFFRQTSDDFFAQPSVRELIGGAIDLAFVDGMHLAEFAIRDFANIERLASTRSVVAFDDVLPPSIANANRERQSKIWTGDVYRSILALKETRPDLDIRVYDVEQKGTCIVSNLNPASGFQTLIPDIEQRLANGEWTRASAAEIREDLETRSVEKLVSDMTTLKASFGADDVLGTADLGAAILRDLPRIGAGPFVSDIAARVELLAAEAERLAAELRTAEESLAKERLELKVAQRSTALHAASVAKLEKALAAQKEQARESRRAFRQSERNRQAILSSVSWRLTKPYRAGRQIAGRAYDSLFGPKLLLGEGPAATSKRMASVSIKKNDFAQGGKADAEIIRRSGLFDDQYYRSDFAGEIGEGEDPISHYCRVGWKSRVPPTNWFNPAAYLLANPEVKTQQLNPLAHYVRSLAEHHAKRAPLPKEPSPSRIAVYTAISGGYDDLHEPIKVSDGVDFFVFSDGPIAAESIWKRLDFDYLHHDPSRTARFVKAHPHLYFGDYDWSIWVDANLGLQADPRSLIEDMQQGFDMATFRHPLRSCIYDEALECIKRKKDNDIEIKEQAGRYREQGYPEHAGLYETSVIVRRHGCDRVRTTMKYWWKEIDNGSRRDQLSFPVAAMSSGARIDTLSMNGVCMRTDHRFVYNRHLKAGLV